MKPPPPLSAKHRSAFMLDYSAHDGCYAGKTDCYYLSIGRGQWLAADDPLVVSVKTFRNKGDRWIRSSEEVPVHRTIDQIQLLTQVLAGTEDRIPPGTFDHQRTHMSAIKADPGFSDQVCALLKTDRSMRSRLRRLRDSLNSLDLDD